MRLFEKTRKSPSKLGEVKEQQSNSVESRETKNEDFRGQPRKRYAEAKLNQLQLFGRRSAT